jgi:hypothetical protein
MICIVGPASSVRLIAMKRRTHKTKFSNIAKANKSGFLLSATTKNVLKSLFANVFS